MKLSGSPVLCMQWDVKLPNLYFFCFTVSTFYTKQFTFTQHIVRFA